MLSEHKPIAVAQLDVLALALVLVACGGDDRGDAGRHASNC